MIHMGKITPYPKPKRLQLLENAFFLLTTTTPQKLPLVNFMFSLKMYISEVDKCMQKRTSGTHKWRNGSYIGIQIKAWNSLEATENSKHCKQMWSKHKDLQCIHTCECMHGKWNRNIASNENFFLSGTHFFFLYVWKWELKHVRRGRKQADSYRRRSAERRCQRQITGMYS